MRVWLMYFDYQRTSKIWNVRDIILTGIGRCLETLRLKTKFKRKTQQIFAAIKEFSIARLNTIFIDILQQNLICNRQHS